MNHSLTSTSTTLTVTTRFTELVPIDNPSGGEAEIRSYITDALQHFGVTDMTVDTVGNLLVRVPGKNGCHPILLSAHMDSVPPCHGIEPVADTDPKTGKSIIRSAGKTILGADDKAGIAVILEVVRTLFQQKFQHNHPLELFFTVQEEVGLEGAKAFDFSQLQSPYGYVLDGEGPVGMIFHEGSTQQHFHIHCQGKPAHAGMNPELGVNAIVMLSHILARFPNGRFSEQTTVNVGTLSGGKALNVVAAEASLKGEMRSRSPEELDALEQAITEVCQSVEKDFPLGKVSLTWIPRYQQFSVPPESPVIQRAQSCMTSLAVPPSMAPMNIGSDAHILNQEGLPTVVLGMGFYHSHSLGEYIFVEELERVTGLTLKLMTASSSEEHLPSVKE